MLRFILLSTLLWSVSFQSVAADKPNILLILADDLGYNDVGFLNSIESFTPTIDKLADKSIIYSRFYTEPTCVPARISLLSGQESSRVSVSPTVRGITPEVKTLPKALTQEGYHTVHVGKWHVGSSVEEALPHFQGFKQWFGNADPRTLKNGGKTRATTYIDPWLQTENSGLKKYKGHLTELLTDYTIDTIKSCTKTDSPWFINLWYFAPHFPMEASKPYLEQFKDDPEAKYKSIVAQMDHEIGRIIDLLKELKLYDNTLILFLSDNGGDCKVRKVSNAPFTGKKASFNEGALRTPMFIKTPGNNEKNEIDDIVFIEDLMPTILSYVSPEHYKKKENVDILNPEFLLARKGTTTRLWEIEIPQFLHFGYLDESEGIIIHKNNKVQLWNEKLERFNPSQRLEKDNPLYLRTYLQYREKFIQNRTVKTEFSKEKDGKLIVTGEKFRRTPGHGPWSMQMNVDQDWVDNVKAFRIWQGTFMEISFSNDLLEIQLFGKKNTLDCEIRSPGILSVSTFFRWNLSVPEESEAKVKVFWNEKILLSTSYPIDESIQISEFPATTIECSHPDLLRSDNFTFWQHFLSQDQLENYSLAREFNHKINVNQDE